MFEVILDSLLLRVCVALQVMKRPGVEAFLLEMGKRYEVVIYTDETAMYADPVINKIDPHRAVLYRLYRQETQVSSWGS